MSIEKYKPSFEAGKLTHESKPFSQICNKPLQECKNLEALALWCHLQSRGENWILHPQQLRKHFNIGRDKIYALLNFLIQSNLLVRQSILTSRGTHESTNYIVLNGLLFLDITGICEENRPNLEPLPDLPDPVNQHYIKEREIKIKEGSINPSVDFEKSTSYKDDPLFMKFYAPYPNKQKPDGARKAFYKHKPDEDFVDMLVNDVISRINNNWLGRHKSKIPHPATYLNGKEWEGEIYSAEKKISYAKPGDSFNEFMNSQKTTGTTYDQSGIAYEPFH